MWTPGPKRLRAEPKKMNPVCVTIADCNKTDLTTSGNLSVT